MYSNNRHPETYIDGYANCEDYGSCDDDFYDFLTQEQRDELIRPYAHRLWEREGRPNGDEYRWSQWGFSTNKNNPLVYSRRYCRNEL